MMKTIIFGNGEITSYRWILPWLEGHELAICCDGGLRHMKKLGLRPHVMLGDFDSVDPDDLENYIKQGIACERHPVQKDETDMELCVRYALTHGTTEILIFGGTGSRFDHTLANVLLLKQALQLNIPAWLLDQRHRICMMDRQLTIKGEPGDVLSLLPVGGDATGVTTEGLQYPLRQETLYLHATRGISNVFERESASIAMTSGLLLVVHTKA